MKYSFWIIRQNCAKKCLEMSGSLIKSQSYKKPVNKNPEGVKSTIWLPWCTSLANLFNLQIIELKLTIRLLGTDFTICRPKLICCRLIWDKFSTCGDVFWSWIQFWSVLNSLTLWLSKMLVEKTKWEITGFSVLRSGRDCNTQTAVHASSYRSKIWLIRLDFWRVRNLGRLSAAWTDQLFPTWLLTVMNCSEVVLILLQWYFTSCG